MTSNTSKKSVRVAEETAQPVLRPRAVKWNSPFYGIDGEGWFLGVQTFTNYVKVTFFLGRSLQPVPPGGKAEDARWIDIYEDDFDEVQTAKWVKQAAALAGWGTS